MVIDFFPKESVLYDGLNILSEVDETVLWTSKEKVNQFLKIGGKVVEWFFYKEYVLYKCFVFKVNDNLQSGLLAGQLSFWKDILQILTLSW